ncbi:MAG TPA: GH3 auxin-responsive promoter family protein [Oligoflexia bacterium]|nr:GH3 auxin-responsive promoter family protein [Oligoflexia bacterium]HMP26948.1 GH3 auxin-responsive promoter family protein [Oligoflexia bacterium]
MFNLTPLLKTYTWQRTKKINSQDPALVQECQLKKLLSIASQTEFGKLHDFKKISTIKEYQSVVPLRRYEDFWRDFWQSSFPRISGISWPTPIKYFAVSSGTSSGRTKYIPISREMLDSNKQAGLDLLTHHLNNKPQSQIFGGKSFFLGGSTDLAVEAEGIVSGDLSGIAVKNLPWWARLRYYPPAELALLKNWEEKIEKLASGSLQEDIRMISGVPSWLLIFFKKVFEFKKASPKLANCYPNLELLVHGGVNFANYQKTFHSLLEGSNAELREVYPASEGFIAIADRGPGEGLRLILDHGIFFEFVPLEELEKSNPTRHWLGNIQKEINYAVILTTCAGLWSYILGDTVKFIDLNPPRLLITGRTSYYLSAFGEHLTGDEIEKAISLAADAINKEVAEFSVTPVYPAKEGEKGGHLFIVEFRDSLPSKEEIVAFESELLKKLCTLNEDYEAHYANGFGLKAPVVKITASGSFNTWMKNRGKLGGQNKVPRVILDQELWRSLESATINKN